MVAAVEFFSATEKNSRSSGNGAATAVAEQPPETPAGQTTEAKLRTETETEAATKAETKAGTARTATATTRKPALSET